MHTILALGLALLGGASPDRWAIRDVRLDPAEDAARVTILLRDGRIEAVQPDEAEVPEGYREHAGEGQLAVPAFVDAYSQTGCETPAPLAARDLETDITADVDTGMREADRKGIQPSFHAADVLALEDHDREVWRGQGFGSLLSAPHGEILSGIGTLASTGELAPRDAILVPRAYFHGAFRATGVGYPSTLMGYHAQLRQFFLDARRYAQLSTRDDVRLPWDRDLAIAQELTDGSHRLMVESETARDIRRWLRLADELGLKLAVAGGREAWKVAAELRERDVPVVLTLDWGDEPDDPEKDKEVGEWEYREPRAVRAERRRLWEEGRDCAARLAEEGVRFAFGSGARDAKRLLKGVRQAVAAGLDRDVALEALTAGGAEVVAAGYGGKPLLGAIEPGLLADVALWTDHPLEEKARLAAIFVDGQRYEMDLEAEPELEGVPDEGVDASGTWEITYEGRGQSIEIRAELEMDEDGTVTGTFTRERAGETLSGPLEGRVAGTTLQFEGDYTINGMEIHFRFKGEIEEDDLDGDVRVTAPFGQFTMDATGSRVPGEAL